MRGGRNEERVGEVEEEEEEAAILRLGFGMLGWLNDIIVGSGMGMMGWEGVEGVGGVGFGNGVST